MKALAEKRGLIAALDWDPVYIDNAKLDGFLDGLRDINCRESDCLQCGYCAQWTRKAVKVDESYREEMMKLYQDAFGEMYSGGLWGVDARGKA